MLREVFKHLFKAEFEVKVSPIVVFGIILIVGVCIKLLGTECLFSFGNFFIEVVMSLLYAK